METEPISIATTTVASSSRPGLTHTVVAYLYCSCEAFLYNPNRPCKHMETVLSDPRRTWEYLPNSTGGDHLVAAPI